ncbi:hypothetical protein [Clostridium sp. 'White wine YQ']|uniref:hypothetical protein n=1 Tax=Clostridium sp. 'White wine YQ' TaxID=3027474 RepID=UPI002365EFBA|nr:hypothetical protein [Clostridium sp. 'White wine YQ']MDD7796099.1 hypothetical protein [Clostridium sp. 'White wine YQ']
MQDNFEVNSTAQHIELKEECIIAKKVYGRCRQQDCLTPVDDVTVIPPGKTVIKIDSASLGGKYSITAPFLISHLPGPATDTTIAVNEVIAFTNAVRSLRVDCCDFSVGNIAVTNIEPSCFGQEGFFDVSITYTFNFILNLLDAAGNALSVTVNSPTPTTTTDIPAFTTWEKKVSLYGGCVGNKIVSTFDSIYSPATTYCNGNTPQVYIQATGNPLTAVPGTYTVLVNNVPTIEYRADVTIGLFTIIKLYRFVNLNVQSSGDCDIPTCANILPDDPCEYFNTLPFPFDEFDPPSHGDCC